MIILSHWRHLAIDAVIEPSEPDNVDTGVRRSIVASDKLPRTASGGWLRVCIVVIQGWDRSPSYHRQRFVEIVNWNLKRASFSEQ